MKRRPTVHMSPMPGFSKTPCCDKSPLELPIGDVLAVDISKVTCGRKK